MPQNSRNASRVTRKSHMIASVIHYIFFDSCSVQAKLRIIAQDSAFSSPESMSTYMDTSSEPHEIHVLNAFSQGLLQDVTSYQLDHPDITG